MFEKIIGNSNIKESLEKAINLKKASHSYLFIGIKGIGKKLIAKEFAKALLCLENTNCGKCKSCIEFDTNNNPDFSIIEPEGNSIKIDQIRNIQQKVIEKPIISNNKVYIINDADTMTVEAQNCLLKTLEEPPEFVTIILIGENESNFLNTIKSRCTIMHFNKIEDKQIQEYIESNYNIKVNQSIINLANGSIGRAIRLKDKSEFYEDINKMIKNLENYDIINILNTGEIIYKEKDDIYEILEYINILLLNISKTNYKYAKCIEIVEETKKRLKANSNYNMCIDYMLFSIWEEVNEKYSRS